MNCKAYRDEIDAADLEGALSAATERHLSTCDACRAFRGERAALRHLVGGLAGVTAPADFEFRLRARMRAEGRGPRGGFSIPLFKPLGAALAACAAVALTVAYLRVPPEGPAPSSAAVNSAGQSAPSAQAQAPRAAAAEHTSAKAEDGPARGSANENERAALEGSNVTGASAPRRPARARASAPSKTAARPKVSKPVEGMSDFALLPADVKTRRADVAGEVAASNPPVELAASRRPMRVVLRNERGAARVVSMRPVSFGSQEFAGRLHNSFGASNSTSEVVW